MPSFQCRFAFFRLTRNPYPTPQRSHTPELVKQAHRHWSQSTSQRPKIAASFPASPLGCPAVRHHPVPHYPIPSDSFPSPLQIRKLIRFRPPPSNTHTKVSRLIPYHVTRQLQLLQQHTLTQLKGKRACRASSEKTPPLHWVHPRRLFRRITESDRERATRVFALLR